MAAKRRGGDEADDADATSKLSRLLRTEVELEAMLEEARREAKRFVELAEAEAQDRVQQFELQVRAHEAAVRDRIARERDTAIQSIREEARNETQQLDEVDDTTIEALASYVLGLLLGDPGSRGTP